MNNARWHKIINDLKINKSRTILTVLSIAVGIFQNLFLRQQTGQFC